MYNYDGRQFSLRSAEQGKQRIIRHTYKHLPLPHIYPAVTFQPTTTANNNEGQARNTKEKNKKSNQAAVMSIDLLDGSKLIRYARKGPNLTNFAQSKGHLTPVNHL